MFFRGVRRGTMIDYICRRGCRSSNATWRQKWRLNGPSGALASSPCSRSVKGGFGRCPSREAVCSVGVHMKSSARRTLSTCDTTCRVMREAYVLSSSVCASSSCRTLGRGLAWPSAFALALGRGFLRFGLALAFGIFGPRGRLVWPSPRVGLDGCLQIELCRDDWTKGRDGVIEVHPFTRSSTLQN